MASESCGRTYDVIDEALFPLALMHVYVRYSGKFGGLPGTGGRRLHCFN